MTKNAAFREIERKLAEHLAQLDDKKKTTRLQKEREFSEELRSLMKTYRVTASDVLEILESAPDSR